MTTTPIRTWAATHASTVSLEAGPTQPRPGPAPVRLVSFNEVNSWPVNQTEFRLVWAELSERTVIATGSNDNLARIRDAYTGEILRTFTGHANSVFWVAWASTNDGPPLIATASHDNTVRIWDTTTGQTLVVLTGHTDEVYAVEWITAPGGKRLLATGSCDHTARIWDPDTGQELRQLTGHDDWVTAVEWARTAEGQLLLATASHDSTVRIWDVTTGETLRTLTGHTDWVNSLAWTTAPGDRLLLATCCSDNTVRIWDVATMEHRLLAPIRSGNGAFKLLWAPLADGRLLLASTTTTTLSLWDGLTGNLLHSQDQDFQSTGYQHLGWTISPDDRLLLATISKGGPADLSTQLRTWEVVLDPPVLPPPSDQAGEREPILLESIEDITPHFPEAGQLKQVADAVACVAQPGGEPLMATTGYDDLVHLWTLTTGRLVRSVSAPEMGYSVAWDPDNPRRLAVGNGDGTVRIWNAFTGRYLDTLTGHEGPVISMAWGKTPDGWPHLASASEDRAVRIWDLGRGNTLHTLIESSDGDESVAWAPGQHLVATAGRRGLQIWDARDGHLMHSLTEQTNIRCLAWTRTYDGQLILAAGSIDGSVRIWDSGTAETPRIFMAHDDSIHTIAWTTTRDGQPLLATASDMVRIWDPFRTVQLAAVPCPSDQRGAFDWVRSPDADPLLVVATFDEDQPPVTVWQVRVNGAHPVSSRSANPNRSERRANRVLALGSAGMWRPMGLVEDLIQITAKDAGAEATLNDTRLAALANDQGIRRLRELGWPAPARLAFVPLLTSRLTPQEPFEPPAEESPAALRTALRTALATRVGAARPAGIELSELQSATQDLPDRILTLLTILGPRACAADPLLPTRLLHRITQLPTMTSRQLQLLSSGELQREVLERARGTGSHEYNPGTAGLARSGPLNRLLPTQLALPHDLMTMRYLENHLLYRQHRAPAPPMPEVVTLVLDTSPPTYGLVEQVLRLAAHLLVVTLWEYGHQPTVVTLDDPESAVTLARRVDLMRIWTTRTLDEPWPAIKTAVHTASGTGHPVLLLTHHHTPRGGYHTTDRTRLLTAHHPPESPPDGRTHPFHHHLPPNPTRDELAEAIAGLLTQSRDRS